VTNSFHAQDGRRIAYADSGGGGPAVLCLPGLTRNMADYADLSARLAPSYRVIRTDYRGRGASDWAEEPLAEYTPVVEGMDAAALLAHLEVGQATIIGTSRGGIIGMLLAATRPELVTALVPGWTSSWLISDSIPAFGISPARWRPFGRSLPRISPISRMLSG
jgi:pimeloyl-ACP methyl ester carboxylesterase